MTPPPPAAQPLDREAHRALQALINGHQSTAMIYVAAKLGLADRLAVSPQTSDELAEWLGAHGPSLYRLLRGLVTIGVCSERDDGRFDLTTLGRCLQTQAPGSLRGTAILSGEEWVAAWSGLLHSTLTGASAFVHVFGMSRYEHRAQHSYLNEYFNQRMVQGTAEVTAAVLGAYDFSSFRTIADVGGGHGALLTAILGAHPSVAGILFDQPHVVAGARPFLEAAGVAARCQVVGGSFLERIPGGADLHVLKMIIHGWDDEHGLAILENCRRALDGQGTLLLVERVLPTRAEDAPAVIMADLHGLAVSGGRERSESEFRALLGTAGFAVTRVVPTASPFSVIESVSRR
jgi:hypothetical protein